jgi:outer membrane receptor protein involved in Fe transport
MASTIICGVLSLGVVGAAAAQTAPASNAVQEVVVTGTRIQSANMTAVSPVTTVSNAEIKLTGATRIEDLVNSLPQAFAGQGSAVGNGATGTATVDLRDLGVQRTLVLIDGRRLLPGDPGLDSNPPVPDLNFIPTALVQRVEVLTGGASAVYGSDAVAGVVNFIMQKNFEGIRIDANAGLYMHDNTNTFMQNLEKSRGFVSPTGTVKDGYQRDVTLTLGINAPDGNGNATAYLSWRQIDAVTQDRRDYSACTLADSLTAPGGFKCGGSNTTSPSHFLVFNASGSKQISDVILDSSGPGNTVRDFVATDQYNYAPYNFYQRPDTRYTAGVFGDYQVNSHVDAYAQAMFMDDHSSYNGAPSGVFGQTVNVPCSSPLLSAQEVNAFCTAAGIPLTGQTNLALLKRNVEGGPRITDLRHTDYRLLVGAKGDIDKTWSYDVYGQYGTAILSQSYTHEFSLLRTTNALNSCSLGLPSFGGPTCATYNAFKIGGITQDALNYVSAQGLTEGQTVEQIVSGNLTAKLGDYGLKSPWAEEGFGLNVGAEYRRETVHLQPDDSFISGDLAGLGGSRTPLDGQYNVREVFAEVAAPIVKDKPFIYDLTFDAGYRYSDYSTSGGVDAYKFGGSWAPIRDIKFRGTYNRSVRAANILELYAVQGVGLDGATDPCAGPTPKYSASQCARTGVAAGQYGNIAANSANQYNGLLGGNPTLRPEKSDTVSFGAVFQPRFIPGLNFSADYYDIKVTDVIGSIGADTIISNCALTGDAFYCSKVKRAPGTGSLWLGNNGYIVDTNFNLGALQNTGVDFAADYRVPSTVPWLNKVGRWSLNFTGTLITKYAYQNLPGDAYTNCQGYYGTICGKQGSGSGVIPTWRHKLRATVEGPWGMSASAAWRYTSAVDVDSKSSDPALKGTVYPGDSHIAAYSYFDLAATWRVKDRYTFRVGANNVMDVQPPLVGTSNILPTFGNGNTYPQVYDALGRYLFVGLTADF